MQEAWHVLEPRRKFIDNWHIDAITEHLEACTNGEINRIVFNVPPGSSKSLTISVLWHAWEWGPRGLHSLRYLTTSFNDGPVKRDVRKTRDLILSPWYQALWPEVHLVRKGEMSFANSRTGTREGLAFGSLTSQRGDRLVIDDPHSTKTAESDDVRAETARQFREGALDRLNDLEESIIAVMMQRLHQMDVTGVIDSMPELGFVKVEIPMEFEPARKCYTRIGWKDPRTRDGELMDPVRFPAKAVQKQKIGKGDYAYAGQYQQRPAPREGGMFKVDKIGVVEVAPKGGSIVRGWDIAGSVKKTSPYTCGARLKMMLNGDIYIEHMARKRAKIGAAEQLIVDTAEEDGITVKQSIPRDPGSAGLSQQHHLSPQLGGLNFVFTPERGTKEDRAIPFASQVEASKVWMVRGEWNPEMIEEMRNFPNSTFKDQVDALSRAYAEHISNRKKKLGLGIGRVGQPG